jgi:hypothetical protein
MEIICNASAKAKFFNLLLERLKNELGPFLRALGMAYRRDVQHRISSQDGGRWATASKWTQARTGRQRVLAGAEKFVRTRVTGARMVLYGDTGGDWTLTQHHFGFENKQNREIGGRIQINVVDPGPLGLSLGTAKFSWAPGNSGKTPARRIWPDEAQAELIARPRFEAFLHNLVEGIPK